jgi:hypothetical protein
MAAARKLVEAFLTGREQGTIEPIEFNLPPDEPADKWADYDLPTPTLAQGAAALAALHDVRCPGVEKVIYTPAELPPMDEAMAPTLRRDWHRALCWRALLDRARELGDYALPWFVLQLRRFERDRAGVRGPDADRPDQEVPAPPASSLPAPAAADGTVKDSRIWLKGKPYCFTPGLRDLLSYLLANANVSEEQVIKDFGMSGSSHLHKRLRDLRNKLAEELKKSGWRLHIKTEETLISCKWEEAR